MPVIELQTFLQPGIRDPSEKAVAPHSSTLAWKIPWMEEPGGPQSIGSLRVGQDSVTSLSLFTSLHWRRKWQPPPVFLPGESQGRGSLMGCRLWGRTESDTTEATQQQQQRSIDFSLPGNNKCFISFPKEDVGELGFCKSFGLPQWFSKESSCNAGAPRRYRFDPWVRKIPGEGNGNPLQYSCLGNSRDGGAWQATVHGFTRVRHNLTSKQNKSQYISQ